MSPALRLATPVRSILVVLLILLILLAGCSKADPEPEAPEVVVRSVDGWVLDHLLQPLDGATVRLVGGQVEATVDAGGHWSMDLPDLAGYTFEARAAGHEAQSRTLVFESEGQHKRLNFSLSPEASREKQVQVHQFDGFIECSAFASAEHSHGGSGRPEGENPLDCGTYATTQSVWSVDVPPGADGMVLEIVWRADTPLADNLLVIVDQVVDGRLDFLAFNEGSSPLKVPIPALAVEDRFAEGGVLQVDVQIGGGPDREDVAVGAAIQQRFQGFTSIFFNHRPEADYSITE